MSRGITECNLTDLGTGGSLLQTPFWAFVKSMNGWVPRVFRYEDYDPFLLLSRKISRFSIAYVPSLANCHIPHCGNDLLRASGMLRELLPDSTLCIRYDSRLVLKDGELRDSYAFHGMEQPGFSIQPVDTVIIDTADEPWNSYRARARRSVRHAQKCGITLLRDDECRYLDQWYSIYLDTSRRAGFKVRPKSYIEGILSCSDPHVTAELYCCFSGNELSSGAVIAGSRDRSLYLFGASSVRGLEMGSMYALQDYIIRRLHETGCSSYDLYGIAPAGLKEHHLSSLTLFKTAFGGCRERYLGLLDYPCRKYVYSLYRSIEACRVTRARGKIDKEFSQH